MADSADLAIILRVQEENTQALKAIQDQLKGVEAAVNQTTAAVDRHNTSLSQMTVAFIQAHLSVQAFNAVFSAVTGTLSSAATSTLTLSSNLQQAQIGFTAMLGSAQKADEFIGQLQDYAESTAFTFPSIEQGAQRMLGMGFAAEKVLPTITDISNALAGVGAAGNTQSLDRITLAFGQIQAKGKLTGEEIRQLANDNIPVMAILTEGLHKSAAEITDMGEKGKITSDVFFSLFHDYSVMHFGDIQAQQAQTWAVASSNLGDVLGRLGVVMGQELFKAITDAALALNEFLHEDRVKQWAADFNASIRVVLEALAPLKDLLLSIMGIGPSQGPAFGPSPAEVQRAMALQHATEQTTVAARDYKAEIAGVDAEIHAVQVQQTALAEKQAVLRDRTEATRASYQAQLEPLKAQQQALQRLAEDSKAAYEQGIKPMEEKLKGIKDRAEQVKTVFDREAASLKDQITSIERANDALNRQHDLENRIADVVLRIRMINAQGDPAQRAALQARMERLQDARDEIQNRMQLLTLQSKHAEQSGKYKDLQKQANDLAKQESQIRTQLYQQTNHAQVEQITKDGLLQKAVEDREKVEADIAKIRQDEATNPLKDRLAQLELQEKRDLAPLLEAQKKLEQDISVEKDKQEKAQAAFATDIQGIGRQIQDIETTEAAALKSLEATSQEYGSQNRSLELQLKHLQDNKKAIEDAKTAAAELSKTVASIGTATGAAGASDPKEDEDRGTALKKLGAVGTSFFSDEMVQHIRDAATATANLAEKTKTFFDNLGQNQTLIAFRGLLGTVWKFLTDVGALIHDLITSIPGLGKVIGEGNGGWLKVFYDLLTTVFTVLDKIVLAIQSLVKGDLSGLADALKPLGPAFDVVAKAGDAVVSVLEFIWRWTPPGMLFTLPGQLDRLGDAFAQTAREIQNFVYWLRQLPGSSFSAGFQSAGSYLGIPGLFPPRAEGGPVLAGRGYIVGERGPEFFVPGMSGAIVPNGGSGGGSLTVVVNNYATITTERQFESVVSDALTKSIRQGRFAFGA